MDGLSRTTKLGPVRNHKGQSIIEFIKRHNLCPKGLVHVDDRLIEHEKNKVSINKKISRNAILLITPNGIYNYIADAYNQAIILQQLHNPLVLKTEPKKEEKLEEKERREVEEKAKEKGKS